MLGGPQLGRRGVYRWAEGYPQGLATGSPAAAPLFPLVHSLTLWVPCQALGRALAPGKLCVSFLS